MATQPVPEQVPDNPGQSPPEIVPPTPDVDVPDPQPDGPPGLMPVTPPPD